MTLARVDPGFSPFRGFTKQSKTRGRNKDNRSPPSKIMLVEVVTASKQKTRVIFGKHNSPFPSSQIANAK
jgi:hypothetical protein